MATIHRRKSMVTSELALLGHFYGQRCRAFRTPPWIRAQMSLLTMQSVLCAFPCPQAWKSQPQFENDLKLQRNGTSGRSLGWADRRLGGP